MEALIIVVIGFSLVIYVLTAVVLIRGFSKLRARGKLIKKEVKKDAL